MEATLSPQQQVWELHRQGLGAKKIAATLGLNLNTVKSWLRRSKAKIESGGCKNCGQKPLGVNRAHEGLEEILEGLQDTSSQIDFLRENGCKPGAIANTLGVNIKKVYNRNRESKRSSFKRSFVSKEELRSLPSQGEVLDLDIARVIYEVFVNSDNPSYETLAMMGTQGLGGWRAKRVSLTRRAGMLKALAVSGREEDVLRVINKKSAWWEMMKDLVEKYRQVGADTYLPNDWEAFAHELRCRVEAALEGVRLEFKGTNKGTKIYEAIGGFTVVVIRPLVDQAAIIVSANLHGDKLGAKQYEGMITFGPEGLKVSGRLIQNFKGVVFRSQKKEWFTMETRLLQPGDKVKVRIDAYGGEVLEVLSWNQDIPIPRVINLKEEDLALAVANKIKEECLIEIAGKLFDYRSIVTKMAM